MIKLIETSAGIIFVQHIIHIEPSSNGCRIRTADGLCIAVHESYENIIFQVYNNRKPEEGELND